VFLKTLVGVYLFLPRKDGLKVDKFTSPRETQELVDLAMSTAVLRPEGTGSFALATSEAQI
jgi:hypothetical protein